MAYAKSNNITVFPSTKRGDVQRSARLLSEQSLVSIINQIVDVDAFVITREYSGSDFQFNIHGYYFKVSDFNAVVSALGNPDNVWASISLVSTSTSSDNFVEIDGQDEGQGDAMEYTGVQFSASQPTGATYYLHLLSKSNNVYAIPSRSQIRFDPKMVFGDITVDGGVVTQ